MTNAQRVWLAIASLMLLSTSCYNEDNKIPITCNDGIQNQDETGVDCGGVCDPCPPSCFNGVLDFVDGWQEVGVDCGGPCEEEGFFCCENERWDVNPFDPTLSESWVDCKLDGLAPGDPSSNSECPICDNCSNGLPDPEETFGGVQAIDCDDDPLTPCPNCSELCDDGLLNGLEFPCGIDCGGACPTPCQFEEQCNNGIQDVYPDDPGRSELGVDCGGCACDACELLCFDGILNGTEVAIDCGGDFCVPCNDPTLCGDGIQNGYETGIDCYDLDDNLSACPPCQTLCTDLIFNGEETDTDCGGPVCGPCSDNLGNNVLPYMLYNVDGVLYESQFTSVTATRTPSVDNVIPDQLSFTGGVSHSVTVTLADSDLNPGNFNPGMYLVNNTDLSGLLEVQFIDNDGIIYTAANDPVGIDVNITSIQFTAPVPPMQPGGTIEGTFSGRLFDGIGGGYKDITGGEFRAVFGN